MAARLKVYQASFGFRESVVATANQRAALEAWGAHQNLFAQGLARASDDTEANKAALACPGVPLSRPIGSEGAFILDSRELPKVRTAPKRKAKDGVRAAARAKPAERPKPAPDRAPLETAEAALRELQARRLAVENDFRARRRRLEEECAAAFEDADAKVAAAEDKVELARRAYRDAGGGR